MCRVACPAGLFIPAVPTDYPEEGVSRGIRSYAQEPRGQAVTCRATFTLQSSSRCRSTGRLLSHELPYNTQQRPAVQDTPRRMSRPTELVESGSTGLSLSPEQPYNTQQRTEVQGTSCRIDSPATPNQLLSYRATHILGGASCPASVVERRHYRVAQPASKTTYPASRGAP